MVDIHHHAHSAGTTEKELQEVGQLGLPEGDVVLKPAEKCSDVMEHRADTYTQQHVRLVSSYLACWLSLMALMHFPSVSSELLMFPASFSLSPVF